MTRKLKQFAGGAPLGNAGRADVCAEHRFRSVRAMHGLVFVNSQRCVARFGSSCAPNRAFSGSLYTSNCDLSRVERVLF